MTATEELEAIATVHDVVDEMTHSEVERLMAYIEDRHLRSKPEAWRRFMAWICGESGRG